MSHKKKVQQDVKVDNKMEVEGFAINQQGLADILTEVRAIEAKLDSSTFGLAEIKTEVAAIERKLDSHTSGLAEIKTEIAAIEAKLDSPTFGLAEIKTEVRAIEAKLDSPTFGLIEIKSEIAAIATAIASGVGPGFTGNLTTGAVVLDNGANSLVAKVLNNTKAVQTVTVDLFNIATCPKQLAAHTDLVIGTQCSAFTIFSKTDLAEEYEVDFLGIKPGIYAWTAARSNAQNAPLSSSNFIDVNTFRHSELVPLVDP